MSTTSVQQIHPSEAFRADLRKFARGHAAGHRWRKLQQIYEDAVLVLLDDRKHGPIDYLASPRASAGDRPLNIKMQRSLLDRVGELAAQDDTSSRRILYTALIQFGRQLGIDVPYEQVHAADVPAEIRFAVPRRLQGHLIEVAYGDDAASEAELKAGARWKRVTNTLLPLDHPQRVTYYQLATDSDLER